MYGTELITDHIQVIREWSCWFWIILIQTSIRNDLKTDLIASDGKIEGSPDRNRNEFKLSNIALFGTDTIMI